MTKDEALSAKHEGATTVALKLALEAFDYIEHNYMSLPAPATKAIAAIREALASSVATNDTSKERVDETPKQRHEQEPVAWVNQANLNSAVIQRNRGGQGDTHTWSETPTAYHPIPLYTTPPQRKPLTEKRIEELYSFWVVDCQDIVGFARAVERTVKGEV